MDYQKQRDGLWVAWYEWVFLAFIAGGWLLVLVLISVAALA